MNRCEFRIARLVLIPLFLFTLLCIDVHGQTEPDTEHNDSTHNVMTNEGGRNYAPTYYYYINSLFPVSIEKTPIDTSVYHPYNEDISLYSRNLYATLGIFGQAHFSMNFSFYRKHGFSYKTLPYNSYLRTIENWRLFSPEGVYANLQYNFANVKENHFSVAYGQKITENLNFGLGLESIIADGRYVMQGIRTVNLGATLNYKLPSNRYGFEVYYLLNLIKDQENGGILNDSLFEYTDQSPSQIGVRFATNGGYANNNLFQNTVFFRHYLALSGKQNEDGIVENKIGYLVNDIEYGSSKNLFDARNLDSSYFTIFNFSKDTIHDLVKNNQLRTSVLWSSYMPEDTLPDKKNFIRFAAGVMYSFINVKDTFNTFKDHQLSPMGTLHVKLFNRLHIKADALVTLNGYNAGDITINGQLALDFFHKQKARHEIQLNVGFYNYSPDYFFTHLIANNYMWENDFKKQQTITAGVAWEHEKYSIGLNYYTLNNYTLLNENSEPEQINQFVNVYQFAAYIPFHFKGFGINSNIYVQYADNDKVRIPVVVTRQTIYYGFPLFKKALYLQFGFDFLYNTAYYASAYNPVLQQFNLQNDKKIGDYGYLDFYLRAKINRFQLQFKLTHLWAGVFGRHYYLVPHYPAKDLGFAVGVLWRFYD